MGERDRRDFGWCNQLRRYGSTVEGKRYLELYPYAKDNKAQIDHRCSRKLALS